MKIIIDATTSTRISRERIASRPVGENEISVIVTMRNYKKDFSATPIEKRPPFADVTVGTPLGIMKVPMFKDAAGVNYLGSSIKNGTQKVTIPSELQTYVLEKAEAIMKAYESDYPVHLISYTRDVFDTTNGPTKGYLSFKTNYGSVFGCRFGVWNSGEPFLRLPTIWRKEVTLANGVVIPAHEEDAGIVMHPDLLKPLLQIAVDYMIEKNFISSAKTIADVQVVTEDVPESDLVHV